MMAYVLRPAALTDEALSSPDCLSLLKLQEVQVQRWAPAATAAHLYAS
jgi:hypothetical protein